MVPLASAGASTGNAATTAATGGGEIASVCHSRCFTAKQVLVELSAATATVSYRAFRVLPATPTHSTHTTAGNTSKGILASGAQTVNE